MLALGPSYLSQNNSTRDSCATESPIRDTFCNIALGNLTEVSRIVSSELSQLMQFFAGATDSRNSTKYGFKNKQQRK